MERRFIDQNRIEEATFSGKPACLKERIDFRSVYTSVLSRAIETTEIVTKIINFPKNSIKYDWRLNERHYEPLQGLNKSDQPQNMEKNKFM